jgi:hypothetical protein
VKPPDLPIEEPARFFEILGHASEFWVDTAWKNFRKIWR